MGGVIAPLMWAASLLLIAGGVVKLLRPLDAVKAVEAAGLPSHREVVRAYGGIEVLAGGAALVLPGPASAAAVGVLYLAFAAFITRLLRLDAPGLSCGCAGARELPPSPLHVALNLVAAGAAFASIAHPWAIYEAVPALPAAVAAVVAAGVVAIALAGYLAVAYVPTLFGSWQGAS